MKIYFCGNNDNLVYSEGMEEYIFKTRLEERESHFLKKEKSGEIEIEEYARGSTCIVYEIKTGNHVGKILKYFCPQKLLKSNQLSLEKDGTVRFVEGGRKFIRNELKKFLRSYETPYKLEQCYIDQNINLYVKPKLVLTTIGYALMCEKTGDVLEKSFNRELENAHHVKIKAREFLSHILEKIFRVMQIVKMAHEAKICMFDIKPKNMCVLTGDMKEEELLVRLFDYGSSVYLDDFVEEINKFKEIGFKSWLKEKFFSSNDKYYSIDDIKKVVEKIWFNQTISDMDTVGELDLIAIKKIFCDILLCAIKGFKTLDENEEVIQTDSLEDILYDFFLKFSNSISDNLFESFNIYCLLKEFLKANNVYDCLKILTKVISVVRGHIFWGYNIRGNDKENVIEWQKAAILFNKNICNKHNFLKKNKKFISIDATKETLRFEDIYNFSREYGDMNAGGIYFNIYIAYLMDS